MSLLPRLRKIGTMTPREVACRARYRMFLWRERRRHARHELGGISRLAAALTPALKGRGWEQRLLEARATSDQRFFPSVHERDTMRQILASKYADEVADMRRQAAAARSHCFTFFGHQFQYDTGIDWHADPVSRRRWPQAYHADVPASGGDRGFGDVKFVWEINRHQFFIDLAKMAFLEASEQDAAELHALHRSWIAAAPYGTGVPWACALEPAFRVFSWLWSYYLLRGAGLMDVGDHLRWLAGFHDHGHFLVRHLERWSSPYNHLAGEASALYQLGVLFPEFEESSTWRTVGRAVLERGLPQQFHADGGSVEQSMFYHHATVGFYLLAALLGRLNGEDLAPEVWRAIERGLEFSLHMQWPDGSTLAIGGGDDGKPIRMQHLPLWDFRYYLAVGAVLFRRADFKYAAGRFWEDALWLLGPAGFEAFQSMPSAPPETRRAFRESGYAVVRSGWSEEADFICFDCGPQAAGLRRDGVASAAHGHADCLSVVVALGGRRVLVDPGFYCYNCPDGWEVHFRKTAVHNTVALDGRDQARHVSKMAWSHAYNASWDVLALEGTIPHAAGHHDGFARAPRARVHRRHVWVPGHGRVVVLDVLDGSAPCEVLVNFQFAPGELRQLGPRLVRFDDRFDLGWSSQWPCLARIDAGGPLPDGGWIAESLGVKRPAPRLRVLGEAGTTPRFFAWVLVDTRRVADGAAHLLALDQALADVGASGGGPVDRITGLFAQWLP